MPFSITCKARAADTHLAPGQRPVEVGGFFGVSRAALSKFSGFLVDECNLQLPSCLQTFNR
jgi:hypothetical protein